MRRVIFFVLLCLSACSLDWAFPASTAGRAGAGGIEGGPTPEAGGDVPDVPDAPPFGVDAAIPADAGCHANTECDAGAICHYPDHGCGTRGGGTCVPPRVGCPPGEPTVCTCDTTTALDECAANTGGKDVSALGNCPVPFMEYACGYVDCYNGIVEPFYCVRRTSAGEAKYTCQGATPLGCSNGCTSCNVKGCTCSTLDGGGWLLDCK